MDAGVLSQLKEHYTEDIHKILFQDGTEITPLFAMAEARENKDGYGRKYVARITTYEGPAVAADPSVADTMALLTRARPTRRRWEIDAVSADSPFFFKREEILAIDGMSADEQFDVIDDEMAMAVRRMRTLMCEQVSGKGWGALCQISAMSVTGFTVPIYFANRFPVGRILCASISEDTDVLYNAGAQVQVGGITFGTTTAVISTVDPTTGSVANPQAVWANNQTAWIFGAGNRQVADPNQDNSLKTSMTGLLGWGRPHRDRHPGHHVGHRSRRRSEPLRVRPRRQRHGYGAGADQALQRHVLPGRKVDTVLVSGTSWELMNLQKDPAKVVEIKVGEYNVGFTAFRIPTVFGFADVMPDPFFPAGTAVAGPFRDKKKAPYLSHAGKKLINLDNFDGKEFERVTSGGQRAYKGQFYFRGQYVVEGPGWYGRCRNLAVS
jgi:hypothetical protein